MKLRPKRSALIFTGSGVACAPMAGITVYAATKIFCRFVYQGWNYDHADKFDVLSCEPGSVKSGLNPTASMLPEFAAAGALRDLGSQDVSGGVIS